MQRRTFLQQCAAAGMAGWWPNWNAAGTPAQDAILAELFPALPKPESLIVAEIGLKGEFNRERRVLWAALQGLVNRKQPRLYLVGDDADRIWPDYYRRTYGIPWTAESNLDGLLERFLPEAKGFVVYEPAMPDSENVATTCAALRGALPASPAQAEWLSRKGFDCLEDFRGRWKDRYEAYTWALDALGAQCHPRLLASVCVDAPHWPSDSLWLHDYLMAHPMLVTDLSAGRRDRADRALLERVYARTAAPGCILGWRCARNAEHDFVGLAARHGLGILCCLNTRNLTVHSAIPRDDQPYTQEHRTPETVGSLENKVYVSFMNTDGDAVSSMLRLQAGKLDAPDHGKIPYTFGFLPAACDLMPGVARLNFERRAENDYFAVPTSGFLYTYPGLHPDPGAYLDLTAQYMRRTGLRAAYLSNWDDNWWWQEIDDPKHLQQARAHIPDAVGFVRGMGESPFEPNVFEGGAPVLYCGEGLHRDSGVYATLAEFVATQPLRPLFIFCLVNHSISTKDIVAAIDRLPQEAYRFVRLDELLLLAQQAYRGGLLPGGQLYPNVKGLKAMLAKEARAAWPKLLKDIQTHASWAFPSETEFRTQAADPFIRLLLDRSAASPGDILAFIAVYDSMNLARLAINSRGINVNRKADGAAEFLKAFERVEDHQAIEELWQCWEQWERNPPAYAQAAEWMRRLAALAARIDPL